MTKTSTVLNSYITFFEKRDHVRIPNASLVPENDPTTLFTSSGMQPLLPYLLGESHPLGKELVNVQNCFRAQDIDEIGDNRHTTFFRMLGNWSLGKYFKQEQIPWFFEFLTSKTEGIGLDPNRLYISVFKGYENIPEDTESEKIWEKLFQENGVSTEGRIFSCGVEDNWWSRAGKPENMPVGEPGGPDTEVYFDLRPDDGSVEGSFKELSDNGRLLEIGNSVFMEYIKTESGFKQLPQKNVDFGGGLERLVAAIEDKDDIFQTSQFYPIVQVVEEVTGVQYSDKSREVRIVIDHFIAAVFIISNGVVPSNKEQGYVLRRLIRRGFDNLNLLRKMEDVTLPIQKIVEAVIAQYKDTDEYLVDQFEKTLNTLLEETSKYKFALGEAEKFLKKKYSRQGDELMGVVEISADDAFLLYTTHGLSPTQIQSLGYSFDQQAFAQKMQEHQGISRKGAEKKFAGGLADHSEKTVMGHTATHLMHQALRDVLGNTVHQTGSNITSERVRFDFSYDKKLTTDEIKKVEDIVNEKIKENLPVHFEMLPLQKAKELGAIGLFDEKYQDTVKVYFIGEYSKEFCGGPHVDFTGKLKTFTIKREEGLGKGARRIYAEVE